MADRQVDRRVRRGRGAGALRAPLLQACLNGTRMRADHPAVPLTADELAADAALAWAAGAHAVHVHPRDAEGAQTLGAGACAEAVAAIRVAAPQVEIGVSTAAFIEPDPDRRRAAVQTWTVIPDVASVNFSEEGAEAVCAALSHRGVQVEAGLASESDAERFVASNTARWCRRILVEVPDAEPADAVAHAARIDALVHGSGLSVLHHGEERATWAVVVAAARIGRDIRIGLEDTLVLPDGRQASGNEAMVRAASELQRRAAAAS